MDNRKICEAWASQKRDSYFSKYQNIFFERAVIYSYGRHFRIAMLTQVFDDHGREVVLVNSSHYSVSTSRHQSYVRGCLYGSQVVQVFVPNVDVDNYSHARNLVYFEQEFRTALVKAGKARKYCQDYLNTALDYQAQASKYSALFSLQVPDFVQETIPYKLTCKATFKLPAKILNTMKAS